MSGKYKPSLSQVVQVIAHKLVHTKACIQLSQLLFELPFCSYNNLEYVCNIMVGWCLISKATIMENAFPYISSCVERDSGSPEVVEKVKVPCPNKKADLLTPPQKRWILQQLAKGTLMLTSKEICTHRPVLLITHSQPILKWAQEEATFFCHVQAVKKTEDYRGTLSKLGKDGKFYQHVLVTSPTKEGLHWYNHYHRAPNLSRKTISFELWHMLSKWIQNSGVFVITPTSQ